MKKEFEVCSNQKQQLIDITAQARKIVKESRIQEGIAVIYIPHATAALVINENDDPNLCTDLISCLSTLVPQGKWLHDRIDDNGAAHLKSAILGPSQTMIIEDGDLVLGTWQSLMLADFDGPKKRKVIIRLLAEN